MKNKIMDIIKTGCLFFSVFILAFYTVGIFFSTADHIIIPNFKTVWLFFAASLLFSGANSILKIEKILPSVRLLFHFFATGMLFFVIFIVGGGLQAKGNFIIIMMAAFAVLYLIFAIIYLAVKSKTEAKINEKEKYTSVFK